MDKNVLKAKRRTRRKIGIRKRVAGTAERPRLSIYRSLGHIYAQLINDLDGTTIVAASSRDKDAAGTPGNTKSAADVGSRLAAKAKQSGVSAVVFDRNGFRYHGRVKALADAAREAGLKF
ncbi:MAG: 50S ribosomal protein L18 [Phycisphaeraceae bacterium]|nr:50S ribosomal protein L18 [Phycisphaeraceae bacterium]QYK49450.1 MAG: 50S ribosomal protein L18 [Phycisphaeraceae bacterium]